MHTATKYIVGSVCALALLSLAVTIYGLAAAYLPVPREWWRDYSTAIIVGTELISFLPIAIVGALASRKFFKQRSVLWSFLCFLTAFVFSFGSLAWESTELLGPSIRLSLEFILIFVIGVPAIIFLFERRYANNSLVPTPETTRHVS